MSNQTTLKACIIVAVLLLLAVLHFTVGTHSHSLHVIHVILGGVALLPILAGAIWFGLRGGMLTAVLVSGVYFVHMRLDWPNEPMENVNQVAMIFVYLFVGSVSGVLVMLQERERAKRLNAETDAQREAIVQGFTSLATALGSRDGYTLQHSHNVARLAVELGRRRGLPAERVESLRLAALVHDIGKIGIRDDVLFKPDKLTPEEVADMHRHPAVAADILRGIRGTGTIAEIVLSHHEKLNGMGYPRGLSNGQIPLEAQILSIADIFCALTEHRPYKSAIMDAAKALNIMEPMAGVELDATTVGLLKELVAPLVHQKVCMNRAAPDKPSACMSQDGSRDDGHDSVEKDTAGGQPMYDNSGDVTRKPIDGT